MRRSWIMIPLVLIAAVSACKKKAARYIPGEMADNSDIEATLDPPSQKGTAKDMWRVEPGIELYHFKHGRGRPALVIHGGPGVPPTRPWDGLKKIRRHKFHYYHQRGCGRSTRPIDRFESNDVKANTLKLEEALGLRQQIADIERIRRILKAKKLLLVGHGYGAIIATLYAYEYPDNVSKAVLIAPPGMLRRPTRNGGIDRVKQWLVPEDQLAYDEWELRNFDYANIFSKSEQELAMLNAEYTVFLVKALTRRGAVIPEDRVSNEGIGGWMVHAIYMSAGTKYDWRPKMVNLKVPILVMPGPKDIYPKSVGTEYASILGSPAINSVPATGHFIYDEQPQAFADMVTEFLRR